MLSLLANYGVLTVIPQAELVAAYEHLAYPPVTLWTTVGVVGATAVYGLLHRYVDDPDRAFVRLAVVALLVSFVPDIGLYLFDEEATAGAAAALAVLHVPPAVVCIAVLPERISERLV